MECSSMIKQKLRSCNISQPDMYSSEDSYSKRSYSRVHFDLYLRCLGPEEAMSMMQEIHDGDYGNHAGDWSLTHKAINQRLYSPKMFDDAKECVKKWPQCHRFAPSSNRPARTSIHCKVPNLHAMVLDVIGPQCAASIQIPAGGHRLIQ